MYDVVIPWRGDDGPRQRIFEWVLERWAMRCPDAVVHVADDGSEVFSRSGSRNAGFADCTNDVVVFADADTPPIPAYLNAALDKAREGVWALPYGTFGYYNLGEETTECYLRQSPSVEIRIPLSYEHRITSWAGMLAVPAEAVEKVGGYDERFTGWGHEDVAFRLALDYEWGPHERVNDGYVVHLWHPRENATFDIVEEKANRTLFEQEYRRKYRWKDERIS